MNKPVVGFIGLGLMGGNMAECLLNNGFKLNVMGRNKGAVEAATALGATEVGTPKQLAEASDIIMLCVTTSEVVESLIYGDDGILAGAKKGAVVIDYGTSIPASTRKIGADLAKKGVGMLDAPLGRTPAHAKDGLLNIMAAGDKETFEKVKPVLEVQGENVFYFGDLGAGHVAKLINNFMGMTTVCTMSQAFAIAKRAGLEPQQLFDVMSAGPSNSPIWVSPSPMRTRTSRILCKWSKIWVRERRSQRVRRPIFRRRWIPVWVTAMSLKYLTTL